MRYSPPANLYGRIHQMPPGNATNKGRWSRQSGRPGSPVTGRRPLIPACGPACRRRAAPRGRWQPALPARCLLRPCVRQRKPGAPRIRSGRPRPLTEVDRASSVPVFKKLVRRELSGPAGMATVTGGEPRSCPLHAKSRIRPGSRGTADHGGLLRAAAHYGGGRIPLSRSGGWVLCGSLSMTGCWTRCWSGRGTRQGNKADPVRGPCWVSWSRRCWSGRWRLS